MDMDNKLHYVAVTGIVVRNGKYLITKRSDKEKAFPGLWTVPGGRLEQADYINNPKDTVDAWYNVLEKVLEREIKEETGISIKNSRYLLSLAFVRSDNIPVTVNSFYCDYDSGDMKLSDELVDYKWVSVEELNKYPLISGIREEIEMVDNQIKKGGRSSWLGKYNDKGEQSMVKGV
ncbi:NUDIX domain-containing protein [Patescibacteria group bacterium]|nr:NUDIX domain-containing protein [Patescibacteria group bacterium]